MSKNKSEMEDKKVSKERRERERELIFYLRYYKELRSRGYYKAELDFQIDKAVEDLKELD